MTAAQAGVYVPEFLTMDATLASAMLTAGYHRIRGVLRNAPSDLQPMLQAYVAGHLYLTGPGAAAAGQQASAGPIQSASAGGTSISFGGMQARSKGDEGWNTTAYGRMYLQLATPYRGPGIVL
jgi:hypothetical protein